MKPIKRGGIKKRRRNLSPMKQKTMVLSFLKTDRKAGHLHQEGRTGGKMTISLYCNMVGRIPKNSTNPKHTDKKMNLISKVNQVSETYKSRNSIT